MMSLKTTKMKRLSGSTNTRSKLCHSQVPPQANGVVLWLLAYDFSLCMA